MTTLLKSADTAFSYTLTVRDSAGTLITPTVTPTASMFTDSDRTLGEVALTVTTTAQPQVFTVSGPATAEGRRYLKHVITTSLGVRNDTDDDILFQAVVGEVGEGRSTLDLINETRHHLRDFGVLNELAAATSSATTVTFQRAVKGVSEGTLLSVDLETMYVWTVDAAAKTADVRRGHEGSTPAVHAADALVRIGPDYSDFMILRALNAELRALSGAGLGPVKALALTSSSTGVRTYDLATDVIGVLDVRFDADNTANVWPSAKSWVWLPDMPTADFASGHALRLDSPVPSGRPLRVFYRAALGTLSALTDDVVTMTGLAASALDIPPLGAAWRLSGGAEVERNQTRRQGDSRRAGEVPSGARMRSTLQLQQIRQARIREEQINLSREWQARGG